MRYRLILNPSSRSGRGQKHWEFWKQGLQKARVDYETFITQSAGEAFQLARDAEGECVVTAVGGDGTINEVLDGILQSGNPGLQMGVLYAGTSPDFCRFHGIPVDYAQALDVLLNKKTRLVDACRIRYYGEGGKHLLAHFGCSCNIGMGASIARFANRLRRRLGDKLGTGAAVMKTVFSYRPLDLELRADGEPLSLPKVNNLCVIKNPYLASGLKLELDVKPDDGNLWLMGLYGKSKIGMSLLFPRFYTGSIVHRPEVYLQKCQKVEVYAAETQEIEFDGDPHGYLPVEIELLPKAVRLKGSVL
ncbi:MAG: hypothetical protein EHM45_04075 [Desulfobacteraceae bacterium]|nr:MAG: hypothetical protein EHM45_04075 [Desulfobacteraceae bacterium]